MRNDLAGGGGPVAEVPIVGGDGFARMVLCRCVRSCPDDFGARICAWGLIGKTK
jgi:hypothetical protein